MAIKGQEAIRFARGYGDNAYTYYPVVVVGAGLSGIAMGCRLKEVLGFDQFRIFDRQSGVGGTWWINRYPGVACDVMSTLYQFSFALKHDWSSFFACGEEILMYLQRVCEKYQIVDKIQLNTDVTDMQWLEKEEVWQITLQNLAEGAGDLSDRDRKRRMEEQGENAVYISKEVIKAKAVISAVGALVEPKGWPDSISGVDGFEGNIFHSSRWDYDVELAGKDVVVVGTGASAVQFVPYLTQEPYNARSVTQIMRSAPWVSPKPQPPFGKQKWNTYSPSIFSRVPTLAALFYWFFFLGAERDFFRLFYNKAENVEARRQTEVQLVSYMKGKVPTKYHEILTPDHEVGCKRRLFNEVWFTGLNDSKINLTTKPLTSVQPKSVTLGPERTRPNLADTQSQTLNSREPVDEETVPADVIILANGFETLKWLHPLRVRGKGGKLLDDFWAERGGAQAYMGTAMDGFPNFFLLFGPNTGTGHSSLAYVTENMVNYALKFLRLIVKGDANTVDVKKEAEIAYTNAIQERLKDTVWTTGGCTSWYRGKDGWISNLYPYSQIKYTIQAMFPRWNDWNIQYTQKGRLKQKLWHIAQWSAFAICIFGVQLLRKQRGN